MAKSGDVSGDKAAEAKLDERMEQAA